MSAAKTRVAARLTTPRSTVAEVIGIDDAEIDVIERHGVAEERRGNVSSAVDAFRMVAVLRPLEHRGWALLARAYTKSGDFARAGAAKRVADALEKGRVS